MIIYGDSYTSGENNRYVSFADYLQQKKCGISGSCLGEYSIYPVRNGSFLSLYQSSEEIVLLEYGINDAASLAVGYASEDMIKVSVAQVADILKSNEVYFLALTQEKKDLELFCSRYANYLNYDYLKELYAISDAHYLETYEYFLSLIQKKFQLIYMLPCNFQDFAKDGIHPTDKGYRIIAKYLKEQLQDLF